MGPGNGAELVQMINAGEGHKLLQVTLIGAPSLRVVNIGEPSHCRRNGGQLLKLRSR
ncbi:MAG: hypothetical protein NVS3B3_20770 [Aquirhabdus sp.]